MSLPLQKTLAAGSALVALMSGGIALTDRARAAEAEPPHEATMLLTLFYTTPQGQATICSSSPDFSPGDTLDCRSATTQPVPLGTGGQSLPPVPSQTGPGQQEPARVDLSFTLVQIGDHALTGRLILNATVPASDGKITGEKAPASGDTMQRLRLEKTLTLPYGATPIGLTEGSGKLTITVNHRRGGRK